jgi:DNA-binding transcriptional LysR family regulator
MELYHLQSFVAAAESQSFTSAAKVVAITQAAVSQHIAALERELGCARFHREGRKMIPTDAGRRLYDRARKILDLIDEARHDIGKPPASVRGTLRIASCTVPPSRFFPICWPAFVVFTRMSARA